MIMGGRVNKAHGPKHKDKVKGVGARDCAGLWHRLGMVVESGAWQGCCSAT